MIRGYANSGQAGKSYIGAIAELLMHYPRSIALRCADPFLGVARETKFMPTPADVIGFCERASAPIYAEAAREDRVIEQLKAREEWENEQKDPVLLAKCRAWLDRTDPAEFFKVSDKEHREWEARRNESFMAANRSVFERECKAAGLPSHGISPSLRKILSEQTA